MVNVSDSAVKMIKELQEDYEEEDKSIRLIVVGGGCSGNQFHIEFDLVKDSDETFEANGVNFVVDKSLVDVLKGLEIDCIRDMKGSRLTFKNSQCEGSCDCGESFSM